MAETAAAAAPMTVDFLRARLLSERSVSRASKERADQLAARVAELEEQVRAVTAQRRQAEREAAEMLAVLESQGFCGSLSDGPDDSGSDNDHDDEKDGAARVTDGDAEQRDQEPAAAKGEAEGDGMSESTALQPDGGLSWKGRSVSPRKARQLRQRHRRSYTCFLVSEDPSPKYRMGQSCRKNKRKELSSGRSAALENGGDGGGGRTELVGVVGGDDRSSGDGGGQYVIRYEKDGEMERVLEKQAELIGQYQAEEKAQRDWEMKFNDNRSSPKKGDVVQPKPSGKTLSIAEPPENALEEPAARRRHEDGEHHDQGPAAISAQGSSMNSTNQDQQGDANSDGCSSNNANSGSSLHLATRSPSVSSDTLVSKVSDWSSSRFHDHADDDQLDDSRSRREQPSSTNDIDVESVLQALQRARISLQQKLGRPLPPSQVTLALPAPWDEYRTEEDLYNDDGGGDSYRGEPGGSSPSRQEMLALPAPEDYHSCRESASLSVDGTDTTSLTEKPSSSLSSPRQEILALSAPGDDRLAGERGGDMKIPVSSPGLFRLPTDSFPDDEVLSRNNGSGLAELTLRVRGTACARHGDDDDHAGVSAEQFYDPLGSGRRNVPPSSGFTVGRASFLSGIPGLPEKLRRASSLGDADLFMQHALDYTVTNKWML